MLRSFQMVTENKQLMSQARTALQGQWNQAVLAYLIYFLITGAISAVPSSPVVNPLVSLIIGGPMAFGMAAFSLAISRNQSIELGQIFSGFNQFGRTLTT